MLSEKRLESCAHGVARRVYEEGRPLATGQILDPLHDNRVATETQHKENEKRMAFVCVGRAERFSFFDLFAREWECPRENSTESLRTEK